ncbi:16S rRNA (cytidine(1402)-2'-O)-methyltransferase [Luteimonas chenhongjianii]|uniref:Ribosomal RNA small subunit methyltransferase I n=1 Tax=Luteimonas chenhongjianii TaxID=2006110 RepID=A0A290XHT1_9GAMM|nr:16S rRNA (cytidine(1402)-2'-O)-methyltransferase [Luteimonas chenhongjianii]ATD68712.1 16S rRNA (cytidine(1402)-2'-O)-methyltransferase [Luteimonas chenhongjianii]
MTDSSRAPGVLHVVATPIGNLGDLSPRAQDVLRSVDAICAEDTRHTRQLLGHFGIDRPLLALHEHNEDGLAARLVERLRAGDSLALVSDAGTPLVSDPGFRLVRAARAAGLRVSPVPGPSALIAALSVAGLPSDRFVFEGFLPAKAGARRERLQTLAAEPRTLLFYESSHRIEEMLADAVQAFGGTRPAVVARELTKLFETVLDGPLETLAARVAADADQRRGEFVVLVEGAGEDADARLAEGRRVYALLSKEMKPSLAAKLAADITGAPRKALYGMGGGADSEATGG